MVRGDMRPLEDAKQKFAENACFRMSKVEFQAGVQQEYLHTPLKFSVDLKKTKFDPLVNHGHGQVIQPEPAMTLSEVKELQQNQRFDVTALVSNISKPRNPTSNRMVQDVHIIDQSAGDAKVQELKWSFWSDSVPTARDRATINILREAQKAQQPLSFFALNGKKSPKGYSIENSKDFFVVEAVGARAAQLAADAEKLHAAPAHEREVLEQIFDPTPRNYDEVQGVETFCKILANMSKSTGVRSIDDEPTLWQLNWIEIAWPEGDEAELCTKNGERLFPSTYIRDASGSGPRVRMTEESVLALARVSSKQDFLVNHAAGRHTFPSMASVKVLREVQKSKELSGIHRGASQSAAAEDNFEYVNFKIVHAIDQPLGESPKQATLELIPFMPTLDNDTSCILPGALHMLKTSSHYAFQVCLPKSSGGESLRMPCQKVLSVVKSTKSSVSHSLGSGFKLVTQDIEDVLGSDVPQLASATPTKFVLSSTCTLENLTAYRLDPPRSGPQHALVTITGKVDDAFVVEQVQLLTPAEAADAQASLLKLLHLAVHLHTNRKRAVPWDDQASPAKAKKCRALGRSPTSADIDKDLL